MVLFFLLISMKNIGWLFFIAMICYAFWQMSKSFTAVPVTEQWIETKATVLDTRSRVTRRNTYAYAKVSFTATDGNTYETEAKLLAIPFLGTTLSPKDTISILYDADKPMIAKSPRVHFVDTYGLYILIGAGIFFSVLTLRKTYAKRTK